jgi:hypothetical protein
MSQGRIRFPADAIPFYLTVVTQLEEQDLPCLREMAARWMALCLYQIGDRDGAVTALCDAGLPAALEAGEGKISLADLLVLPPR